MKKQETLYTKNISHRDNSLDALCGLFIIEMILRHAMEWSSAENDQFYVMVKYVLYCMMPWFFYKSGMFYKNKFNFNVENRLEDSKSRKRQLMETISHDARKLLLPFALYTFIGTVLSDYRLYLDNHQIVWRSFVYEPIRGILLQGSTGGNLPLWFLLSLFLVKAAISFADYINIKHVYLFTFSLLLAWGGGFMAR